MSSADWADSDSDEDPDYIPTDEDESCSDESCSDESCSDEESDYYVENTDMLDDLANFAENRLW
jgi:hypothetical protein